jgi:hypothetical protein
MAEPKDIALAALARTGKCPSGADTQVEGPQSQPKSVFGSFNCKKGKNGINK